MLKFLNEFTIAHQDIAGSDRATLASMLKYFSTKLRDAQLNYIEKNGGNKASKCNKAEFDDYEINLDILYRKVLGA